MRRKFPVHHFAFLLLTGGILSACADDPVQIEKLDAGLAPVGSMVSTGGSVTYLPTAPPSVERGALSTDGIVLFDEEIGHELQQDIAIDVDRPGSYTSSPSHGTIPKGTVVNSHFIHFDPDNVSASGKITFDAEIIGIIVRSNRLNASDSELGAPGTRYPRSFSRGFLEGADAMVVAGDLRTIEVTIRTNGGRLDQLRVLTAASPADDTPPLIAPTLTGTAGDNGWFTSDVAVAWTVSDDESEITDRIGCDDALVDSDNGGLDFTCSATSTGGTASETVTVMRDATPPTVTYGGAQSSYEIDETLAITCTAEDALSGPASDTCVDVTGAAYSFGAGESTFSAQAVDNAGNTGTGSVSFGVVVTHAGLCGLTKRFVGKTGVARAMCAKLDVAEASGRPGPLRAYVNQVRAQSGKSLTEAHAAILIELAGEL